MTGALEAAYLQITNAIPQEILTTVFRPFLRQKTLEQCIFDDVIGARVYKELAIFAGNPTSIFLEESMVEHVETNPASAMPNTVLYAIYRIPPEKREYRDIIGVISVTFSYMQYGIFPLGAQAGNPCYNPMVPTTMLEMSQQAMIGAAGGIEGYVKPIPELMGNDLVKLTPTAGAPMPGFTWLLNCKLAYDKSFTNLNQSSVPVFATLCQYAVESWLWSACVLKIDQFASFGGIEVGKFKDIIDSYEESEQKYQELKQTFRHTSSVLEPATKRKLIYAML